jgi:putative toxin-antitoxin system antitoxin component (TIGR02293 family)
MAQSLADYPTSIDAFIDHVTEVLGDREAALRWMGTPVQALDYSTPVSLLNTDAGFARVTKVLEQLQHGVY